LRCQPSANVLEQARAGCLNSGAKRALSTKRKRALSNQDKHRTARTCCDAKTSINACSCFHSIAHCLVFQASRMERKLRTERRLGEEKEKERPKTSRRISCRDRKRIQEKRKKKGQKERFNIIPRFTVLCTKWLYNLFNPNTNSLHFLVTGGPRIPG